MGKYENSGRQLSPAWMISIELVILIIITIYWSLIANAQQLAWACLSCRRWHHWCFHCSVSNQKMKGIQTSSRPAIKWKFFLLRKAPECSWGINYPRGTLARKPHSGHRGRPWTSVLLHSVASASLLAFAATAFNPRLFLRLAVSHTWIRPRSFL